MSARGTTHRCRDATYTHGSRVAIYSSPLGHLHPWVLEVSLIDHPQVLEMPPKWQEAHLKLTHARQGRHHHNFIAYNLGEWSILQNSHRMNLFVSPHITTSWHWTSYPTVQWWIQRVWLDTGGSTGRLISTYPRARLLLLARLETAQSLKGVQRN